jgi:hypothetical protein
MKRFVFILTVVATLGCCGTAHAQSFGGGSPFGGWFSPTDLLNGPSATPAALSSPTSAFGLSSQSPFGSLGGLLGGGAAPSTSSPLSSLSSPFSSFFGSLLGGGTPAAPAASASPLTSLFSGFGGQPGATTSSNPIAGLTGAIPQLLSGFSGSSTAVPNPAATLAPASSSLFNLSNLGGFGQIAQAIQPFFKLF